MVMSLILWTLPVPSTSLLRGVSFQELLGRTCGLTCEYEDEKGNIKSIRLLFEHVLAFKCTYLNACTPEMVEMAYDKVVSLGSTEWLATVRGQANSYAVCYKQEVAELKHLMIYFDDGPCYEFICQSFNVEEGSKGHQVIDPHVSDS